MGPLHCLVIRYRAKIRHRVERRAATNIQRVYRGHADRVYYAQLVYETGTSFSLLDYC